VRSYSDAVKGETKRERLKVGCSGKHGMKQRWWKGGFDTLRKKRKKAVRDQQKVSGE